MFQMILTALALALLGADDVTLNLESERRRSQAALPAATRALTLRCAGGALPQALRVGALVGAGHGAMPAVLVFTRTAAGFRLTVEDPLGLGSPRPPEEQTPAQFEALLRTLEQPQAPSAAGLAKLGRASVALKASLTCPGQPPAETQLGVLDVKSDADARTLAIAAAVLRQAKPDLWPWLSSP